MGCEENSIIYFCLLPYFSVVVLGKKLRAMGNTVEWQ
jgi:hypothetical protein